MYAQANCFRYDDRCAQWLAVSTQDGVEVPVGVARVVVVPSAGFTSDPTGEYIGKIGRVAVLPAHRGQGIAKQLMLALEEDLAANEPRVSKTYLHAQADKALFYEKLGYRVLDPTSPPFLEENILHVKMAKSIR